MNQIILIKKAHAPPELVELYGILPQRIAEPQRDSKHGAEGRGHGAESKEERGKGKRSASEVRRMEHRAREE